MPGMACLISSRVGMADVPHSTRHVTRVLSLVMRSVAGKWNGVCLQQGVRPDPLGGQA